MVASASASAGASSCAKRIAPFLMLNAVNINLVAFWRYNTTIASVTEPVPSELNGVVFAAFMFVVAAAEVAVGLAIIITVYRNWRSVIPEEADTLRG